MAQMVKLVEGQEFSREEVGLALRNPGMPLEGLRYPITPIGMHYLLIHFDIPFIEPASYELSITGHVRNPLKLTLDDLRARPEVTMPVAMECAGNGRAHLSPRPVSAPWHNEAVGCAEWTGTPLKPILEEAGFLDDAVEVLFTGHDRGVDQDVEQDYERSLSLEEALRDEVILAYEMNGRPLPPQHGSPLRLVVPDWYGMASVKWLKSIAAISEPFEGVQQALLYRYKRSKDDPGTPVTRKAPHALMVPPGVPEYLTRARHLRARRTLVQGRAWSGFGAVGAGGVQLRRRAYLGRRRAGGADRTLRLEGVVLRVGCARARRVRAVRARLGCSRKQAAGEQRRGLEPRWLRR